MAEKLVKITDINIAADAALEEEEDSEYKDYDELHPNYRYHREEEEE